MRAKGGILIIDDERAILLSLESLLLEIGYTVALAQNREESQAALKKHNIDVVLLDVRLATGEEGVELLREFKDSYPFIEVLMISAHGNIEMALSCIRLGAYDFLEKPLGSEKVATSLEAADPDYSGIQRIFEPSGIHTA